MFEATAVEMLGQRACRMRGRLDSLTADEAQSALKQLVEAGQRSLVVDLTDLHYISSAGLRVFILIQKLLAKVGGRVIIFQAPEAVRQIFQLSGFLALFDLVAGPEGLAALGLDEGVGAVSSRLEIDGIVLEVIEQPGPGSRLAAHGSQDKLNRAAYTEADMVPVPAGQGLFGAGLGCCGESFEECRNFFGEALIIDGSLFYQPAVPRGRVDFMLNLQPEGGVDYKFLNAFSFHGPFQTLLAFDSPDGLTDLARLTAALGQIMPVPAMGLVLLAESKGLWGMNLRRSPVIDHQPDQGRDIFHPDIFREWMNFPVEPADAGHIFVGVGVAVADRDLAPAGVLPWLPADADLHVHAAVFGKGPLDKRPERLGGELRRVITELEALKVQHLLGRSRVASGLVGLVALEA
jgi:anti-anti-sigma factor